MTKSLKLLSAATADLRAIEVATENIYVKRCLLDAIGDLELALDYIREAKDTRPRIK